MPIINPDKSLAKSEEVQTLISKFPDKKSSLIQLLYYIQDEYGKLTDEILREVSTLLEMSYREVMEVLSHCELLHLGFLSENFIYSCRGITCSMFGGKAIYDGLLKQFGAKELRPFKGGKLSLQRRNCLGGCDQAPCMRVNGVLFTNLDFDKCHHLLKDLK